MILNSAEIRKKTAMIGSRCFLAVLLGITAVTPVPSRPIVTSPGCLRINPSDIRSFHDSIQLAGGKDHWWVINQKTIVRAGSHSPSILTNAYDLQQCYGRTNAEKAMEKR